MATKSKRPPRAGKGKAPRDDREELFCLEFIKDENAARAARDAGYSEAAAKEIGYRLLTKAHIRSKIRELLAERNRKVKLDADAILLGIKELAVSDIRRLINPKTGALLSPHEWPDDIASCVASFKVKELFDRKGWLIGYLKEVKLWDKPKSQENLGRNQALFTDVGEHRGAVTLLTATDDQIDAAAQTVIKNA